MLKLTGFLTRNALGKSYDTLVLAEDHSYPVVLPVTSSLKSLQTTNILYTGTTANLLCLLLNPCYKPTQLYLSRTYGLQLPAARRGI